MQLVIRTKNGINGIRITDLDRVVHDYDNFVLEKKWYRLTIPGTRYSIVDIIVNGESIKHYLNSGSVTPDGYQIWIHGDLSQLFARVSECIAQDDLLQFKLLEKKYLLCESWNENLEEEFIPYSVKQFFANGEGPFWYHKDDRNKLPYIKYEGEPVPTDILLDEDLIYQDTKFYGKGQCKSLKVRPTLPTIAVDDLKSDSLRNAMKSFGFTDILQMQQVTLEPNSVLPVHRDDFTYTDGRHIIEGPTQLYFVLTGAKEQIKFKFKNVGLISVDRPIFVNNRGFVHSLVYTGTSKRTVLLVYGKRRY
tara:strand:- start:503 stop:1420 length:918 start_codon:yes stop_codon:yes gene_type:complete